MSTSTFTPRSTFRDTLAQVAAQARAILPEQVNGRIESAVKLVLAGDVFFNADGTVEVGSASDPMKTYTLAGQSCDCQDFSYGQAPQGWCQHRIAANLQRSVERVLARRGAVPAMEPWPDNDPEPLAQVAGQAQAEDTVTTCATAVQPSIPEAVTEEVTPVTSPLPEAPASCNVYLTISGHKVQVTLRDGDEQRMLARLQVLLDQYPAAPQPQAQAQPAPPASQGLSAAQHNAAAMHRPTTGFCAVHGVQMKENEKDGRRWFSHWDESAGRWCKGK